MDQKKVKDLMVGLEDYAIVDEDACLLDAVKALDKAQARLQPGQMKHRAVLIRDKNGKIIGKFGHLAFLKALEPKYQSVGDINTLARAGLSSEFVNAMMDTFNFWDVSFTDICKKARSLRVKDVCHPIKENIGQDAPITEAIHKFIMWQSLSIPVSDGDKIVGILRLSDLYTELAKEITMICDCEDAK